MKTVIVSGFPGIGKSTLSLRTSLNVLDLDSSKFSWCPSDDSRSSCPRGDYERNRNPNASSDYGKAIIEEYSKDTYDYIFVSTHQDTRKFLSEQKIPYLLVYPDKSRKDEFNTNYHDRGSPTGLIDFIIGNWDLLISDLEKDKTPVKHIAMKGGYLFDYVDQLKAGRRKKRHSRKKRRSRKKSRKRR